VSVGFFVCAVLTAGGLGHSHYKPAMLHTLQPDQPPGKFFHPAGFTVDHQNFQAQVMVKMRMTGRDHKIVIRVLNFGQLLRHPASMMVVNQRDRANNRRIRFRCPLGNKTIANQIAEGLGTIAISQPRNEIIKALQEIRIERDSDPAQHSHSHSVVLDGLFAGKLKNSTIINFVTRLHHWKCEPTNNVVTAITGPHPIKIESGDFQKSLNRQTITIAAMRSLIKVLAIVLVLAILTGVIFERIGRHRDKQRLTRIGQAVDIGGRSLNIDCAGSGSPTVILDTGASAPGYSNMPLQKLFSRETRTCWFDRAGLGWSDPSPVPQTSSAIAADLHQLLHAANIAPPYILVGQSFSGFNVRLFTKAYPNEVAGIVLLDSVQEDQQQYEPRSTMSPVNRLPASVRAVLCRAVPLAADVGLIRLVTSLSGPDPRVPPGFTQSQADVLHGLESQPKAIVASSGCRAWEKSADEARAAGTLGNVPLLVLTAGQPLTTGDPAQDRELQEFHDIWVHKLQPRLVALSTRGKQIIVANSSHDIAGDMPSAAAEAIRQLLSESRPQ
jgi:pimeloyl-ACP methyl ester carboxylesterase